MGRPGRALLLGLLLASCGPAPRPVDTAALPPGIFGAGDQDLPALETARTAFSDPSRTYGNAIAGAEAVLALDYLAGALATQPRWSLLGGGTREDLLRARIAVRSAVGIAPDAPSQRVVDSLLAARNALAAGQQEVAENALDNAAFPNGGAKTLALLANLPYVQIANVATTEAGEEAATQASGVEIRY